MEDGHTPSGGVVRYNFDSYVFPGFSWRGYAVLSRIQVSFSKLLILFFFQNIQ